MKTRFFIPSGGKPCLRSRTAVAALVRARTAPLRSISTDSRRRLLLAGLVLLLAAAADAATLYVDCNSTNATNPGAPGYFYRVGVQY